jgi:hypothetical protein
VSSRAHPLSFDLSFIILSAFSMTPITAGCDGFYDLASTILETIPAITRGSCSPALPSRVYERSNAFGPKVLRSH